MSAQATPLSSAAPGADDAELDVTIVLPTYNEVGHVEAELSRIVTAMDASAYTYEIVAVDDGSSDGTRELLRKREDIRLIEHRRNLGSGGARRTGTRAARGRVVVWTDVDMTYPNERIPELVAELDANGYDQVVGARHAEKGTHKAARIPAKWAIRRLAQYLVDTPIPDLNSGFRAFRREVGDQYLHRLPNGFSCVTTMTMSFLADAYTVGYIDIEYAERAGESKFHWYRDTRKYLLQVIRMVLSYNPLKVFGPIGVALLVFGMLKLGYDLVDKDLRVPTNTLLVIFSSLQILSIGFLADLVVRATRSRDPVRSSRRS